MPCSKDRGLQRSIGYKRSHAFQNGYGEMEGHDEEEDNQARPKESSGDGEMSKCKWTFSINQGMGIPIMQ